ncbi:ATP-dependent RecD-like DNA helicase [Candidatus Igneacidithiobacillus taiwanensis]|uniref:SF1B family DNA helicase RecD2 n=1 Tax=Candidatus Igneacidithiobacillus taiwanensis TaxID=1945924 RepID=UPI0028A1450F|nr:ATP-dependent RecD-like DNA helicase [Candidatus Igneacidithiobacillus taiwanensis]
MNETIIGTVQKLVYSAQDSDFRVLNILPDGKDETLRVIGRWAEARTGIRIEVSGGWEKRNKTGALQFHARSFVALVPDDTEELISWLGSGVIRGIGPPTARKIVEAFGEETVAVLDTQIERLQEIRIPQKKREQIAASWKQAAGSRIILQFLRSVGLGPERSTTVWRQFSAHPRVGNDPNRCVALLKEDPYLLSLVPGIGFLQADKAAGVLGLAADHPSRIRAGIYHALQQNENDGHVWIRQNALLPEARELLGVADDSIIEQLAAMEGDRLSARHHAEETVYAIRRTAEVEKKLAQEILRLTGPAPKIKMRFPEGFRPDPTQERALRQILGSRLGVLTGGPGMGKTTLIRACVLSAQEAGLDVSLCAPTGRAAKRMEEATGVPASTIHRLLGVGRGGDVKHDRNNPLESDWVIVDEVSMLDQQVALWLLQAIPDHARLLFVGDPDQLPSVGVGQVLGDLIESNVVPVARLTNIFRQGEGSGIPVLATDLLAGKRIDMATGNYPSVRFIDTKSLSGDALTQSVLEQILAQRDDLEWEIQVLTPMRQGPLGTVALNCALREAYNPPCGQAAYGRFRIGDRVIQTRNNYDLQVFNGDLGVVTGIVLDEDGESNGLIIDIDGRQVLYGSQATQDLEYSYCLTIHKAQGGQFPAVALIATTQHTPMLKRNLLYTGATRAEKHLLFITSQKALERSAQTTGIAQRKTRLSQDLAEARGRMAP